MRSTIGWFLKLVALTTPPLAMVGRPRVNWGSDVLHFGVVLVLVIGPPYAALCSRVLGAPGILRQRLVRNLLLLWPVSIGLLIVLGVPVLILPVLATLVIVWGLAATAKPGSEGIEWVEEPRRVREASTPVDGAR